MKFTRQLFLQKFTILLALFILSFCFLLSQISFTETSTVENNNSASFIALSDIHFDPFFSCEEAVPNCPVIKQLITNNSENWGKILSKYDNGNTSPYHKNTNYPLLRSALAAVQQKIAQHSAGFIIILGDYLAHDFKKKYQLYSGDFSQQGYQTFVKKTFIFLNNEIQKSFPGVAIYPVIGNNDSYNGDYATVPKGDFFKDTAVIWSTLVSKQNSTFSHTFSIAGYYAFTLPQQNDLRIIILNSVLFSPKAYDKAVNAVAHQQLRWLKQQLAMAHLHHQKVWLFFHILPGVNIFNTVKDSTGNITSFWRPEYLQDFLIIINQYSSVISGIFSSHVHMDGFEIINKSYPILDTFIPGISPLFGNNPGFKLYQYSTRLLQLQNFMTYYLAENNVNKGWRLEYSFNSVYQPDCKQCNLLNGMKKLTPRGDLAQLYQRYYALGNVEAQPITKNKKWLPYYWCGIKHQLEADYHTCLSLYNK